MQDFFVNTLQNKQQEPLLGNTANFSTNTILKELKEETNPDQF
jgi:hypothetical protein